MTVRALATTLLVLWIAFAAITATLSAAHVFHLLNALALAAGAITISAYIPGVFDMWRRHGDGITPAHLLTLGVSTNWLGLMLRLGRWYVMDARPTPDDTAAWAYNVGLWISICAAVLLVGVVALAEPRWSAARVLSHIGAFVLLSALLFFVGPHF